jgi:pyruvate/2-oxoglutarate dehydrogenase complex dihydrolipoamide dehydrogenase (E3) component
MGKQGKRVVMVEQSDRMYGGTCINIGCVPTKSMVYRAEQITGHAPAPDAYRAAVGATADLTAGLRAANFTMIDSIPTATVLTGPARFLDPHTVEVRLGDSMVTVTGRTIVVGAGSQPVWPDVPGLRASSRAVTSTDLLEAEELPRRLVVLGGGYVGLEFAAMYAGYGSEVTVIERHSAILGREDQDIADTAREILARAGVTVVTSALVDGIDDGPEAAVVRYVVDGASHAAPADKVLVALGRQPVGGQRNSQHGRPRGGAQRVVHDSAAGAHRLRGRRDDEGDGITAAALRDGIDTHPSMSEAFNQLLGALHA